MANLRSSIKCFRESTLVNGFRRRVRVRVGVLAVLLCGGVTSHATAEPQAESELEAYSEEIAAPRTFVIGVDSGLMLVQGEVCERGGDHISCEGGLVLAVPRINARALLAPSWQLGGRFGIGFEPGRRELATQLGSGPIVTTELTRRRVQLELMGRYQPVALDGFWVGAALGSAQLQELETTRGRTTIEDRRWGPSMQADLGYDFLLSENVALTLGAELGALFFGDTEAFPDDGSTTYGNLFGAGVAIGVTGGL